MRQSQLFTKTQKNAPAGEMSLNARLLIRGGFVDKLMAGAYTILPLGLRVMKKIENIIREEMNAIGGQEIFMPSLQPKENWETTGRWKTMDDLYKVKDASDREFALGPTHEEIVSPLAKKFLNSYKDLPFAAYQFQNKFRMELRAKSGILRGREFLMKDLYSFHISQENLDEYYEKAKIAYKNIFDRAGIGEKTYLTFASGGSFSKYSHEFQTETEAGEDIIFVCASCNMAINREIKDEIAHCPECQNHAFHEKKAVEVGNIFKLGTKYSAPFDLTVMNEKGEKVPVIMGCYGIGLQRLMGTIVELSSDENGIIWPESVAPFQVHLISLGKNEGAEKIHKDLQKNNIEVLFDDRDDTSAGAKFADADLIGIPWRVVVSEKSLASGGVEVKKRNEKESEIVEIEKLIEKIK
ncbi:MAG: His/Gly/Thr/Pro-type tRNA ligase C-terminal domain-containing protein [Candidatus Moranbacteria bacterium]|nr:His/Gly/Thr/Pro-type tRNA ligase C-terminal domain-containing protein [Candidatus Moranbacteria bacterium]